MSLFSGLALLRVLNDPEVKKGRTEYVTFRAASQEKQIPNTDPAKYYPSLIFTIFVNAPEDGKPRWTFDAAKAVAKGDLVLVEGFIGNRPSYIEVAEDDSGKPFPDYVENAADRNEAELDAAIEAGDIKVVPGPTFTILRIVGKVVRYDTGSSSSRHDGGSPRRRRAARDPNEDSEDDDE